MSKDPDLVTIKDFLNTSINILDQRAGVYGDPMGNYETLGRLVQEYLHKSQGRYCIAHEAAMFMALTKIMRIACGSYHQDNYIDAVNFIAMAGSFQQRYLNMVGEDRPTKKENEQ